MAWIVDPNFGSTLVASPAFAPFPTSGGNRIIGFGSGLVYKDEIDEKNLRLSCTLSPLHESGQVGGNNASAGVHLVARRQPDGSFYSGGTTFYTNNQGYTIRILITRYHGPSDTFTILSSLVSGSVTNPLITGTFIGSLVSFDFAVNEDSLEARVLNSLGQVLASSFANDSNIDSSGNPGIGGLLFFDSTTILSNIYGDNLRIGIM